MQEPWVIAFLVQWLVVLVLVVLVVGLLRHLGTLEEQLRLDIPPISSYDVGQSIGEFALPDVTGASIQSSDLLAGSGGAVLLFVTSTCSACENLLAQFSELTSSRQVRLGKTLIVIGEGGAGTVDRLLESHPGLCEPQVTLLADDEATVLRQFGITSVPTALAIDGKGRVIDQSLNPHAEKWLYNKLGVDASVAPAPRGWVGIVQRVPMHRRR